MIESECTIGSAKMKKRNDRKVKWQQLTPQLSKSGPLVGQTVAACRQRVMGKVADVIPSPFAVTHGVEACLGVASVATTLFLEFGSDNGTMAGREKKKEGKL